MYSNTKKFGLYKVEFKNRLRTLSDKHVESVQIIAVSLADVALHCNDFYYNEVIEVVTRESEVEISERTSLEIEGKYSSRYLDEIVNPEKYEHKEGKSE